MVVKNEAIPPLFGTPDSDLFRGYSVRRTLVRGTRTKVQMVRVRRILWSARKPFKLEVQSGCMNRYEVRTYFFLARFARSHHYIFTSNKSRSFHLGFIIMDIYDLISIRVCIFFPVRYWNQYSFHKICIICSQWKSLIV